MDIQAISAAATIAAFSTLVFLGLSAVGALGSRLIPATRFFRDAISRESGHRYQGELLRMERMQRTCGFSILLFAALFITTYWLNPGSLYETFPEWQLWLLLLAVITATGFVFYRLLDAVVQWRALCFHRDAVVAIGHGLERLSTEHGRIFHDVETSAGPIDHVLVGMRGIYAVHVLARKPKLHETVSAERGRISFSNSDDVISVATMRRKNQALGQALSELCDGRIQVRLVVGTPGWDVDRQDDNSLLIVNERTLPMIKGWRDTQEFLLNDVVETIQTSIQANSRVS